MKEFKNQNFKDLLKDAMELYEDQPKEVGDLIHWALTLDEEARSALVLAYRLMNDKDP